MVYDSSRRGMGRVNDYGVVTVSKPYANVILIGKDASSRITASFHHDPQAPSLVKRGEGRFSNKKLSILIFIRELLGHNYSKTTEIYTHMSTKSLGKMQSPLDSLNLKKGGSNWQILLYGESWNIRTMFVYHPDFGVYPNLLRIQTS